MHRNAPLTPQGRLRLCQRIEDGWTIASAAESMNVSRQTAHKWWRRYRELGSIGLEDRSSRPRNCPSKTPARTERRIVEMRRRHQLGPARLAPRAGIPASTLHRVLQRNGVSRLSDLDRRSGRVIRRIETSRPGELVHIDVKKQAKIPPGGGWKAHGRGSQADTDRRRRHRVGYAHIHSAIDAHSRLAYSEVHADETAFTAVEFWRRASAFFARLRNRYRARDDRQRILLCRQRIHEGAGGRRHSAHSNSALPATDQRQGGTLQPHASQRVSLRQTLPIRSSENPCACRLAPHVQPSPAPHGHWGTTH